MTLACGNAVYLYLTVAFIQMAKAFTPCTVAWITILPFWLRFSQVVLSPPRRAHFGFILGSLGAVLGSLGLSGGSLGVSGGLSRVGDFLKLIRTVPRRPLDGPKMLPHGSKTALDGFKMAQDSLTTAPGQLKTGPGQPKTAYDSPGQPKTAPRRAQDSPRQAQTQPKTGLLAILSLSFGYSFVIPRLSFGYPFVIIGLTLVLVRSTKVSPSPPFPCQRLQNVKLSSRIACWLSALLAQQRTQIPS